MSEMSDEMLATIRERLGTLTDSAFGLATGLLAEVERLRGALGEMEGERDAWKQNAEEWEAKNRHALTALTAIAGAFNCDEHVDDLGTLTQLLIGHAGALGMFQSESHEPTDAMIERAARAMCDEERKEGWNGSPTGMRQKYITLARRALTAAMAKESAHAST